LNLGSSAAEGVGGITGDSVQSFKGGVSREGRRRRGELCFYVELS